jgi:hypothetical protein
MTGSRSSARVEPAALKMSDRWIQLAELAELFALSEESMKRVAKNHGFPLRRLTPYATPGVLESELFS